MTDAQDLKSLAILHKTESFAYNLYFIDWFLHRNAKLSYINNLILAFFSHIYAAVVELADTRDLNFEHRDRKLSV